MTNSSRACRKFATERRIKTERNQTMSPEQEAELEFQHDITAAIAKAYDHGLSKETIAASLLLATIPKEQNVSGSARG
jgi:hypothetical protein